MTTEENIVYQIMDAVRASELTSDEVIDERQVRAYLRTHRSNLIAKYAVGGVTIQEICFQKALVNRLSAPGATEFICSIPNVIQLNEFLGVRLGSKSRYPIPIMSEESYYLSKEHAINKFKPKATQIHDQLTVFAGEPSPYVWGDGTAMENIINEIINEDLVFSAVLSNPDDGIGYDWTTSQYPIPEELLQDLKDNILKKEFNIILQTKSDQVPNMKNDTLRYHDQGKVNQ